jgi:hypothetical protein
LPGTAVLDHTTDAFLAEHFANRFDQLHGEFGMGIREPCVDLIVAALAINEVRSFARVRSGGSQSSAQ